jgi:hypothetical protein
MFMEAKSERRQQEETCIGHLADDGGNADIPTCRVSATDKLQNAHAILHKNAKDAYQ